MLQAIQQHYLRSYYFKPEIIRGQALFRGGQSNKELAEAYEIYFMQLQ